jgi:LPXTG-motif cell wall-anchored protein
MFKQKFLAIFAIFSFAVVSFSNISTSAQTANNTIQMYPGQTRVFTVQYGNDGDMADLENAVLDIRIGSLLTVNRNSLKDKFKDKEYNINFENVSVNSGVWGTRINYRPLSGQDGGSKNPGNVKIQPGEFGYFTFEATLDPNIIGKEDPNSGEVYKNGSVLTPTDIQGVTSVLNFTNGETIPGVLNIIITENPNPREEPEDKTLSNGVITTNPRNPNIGQGLSITVSDLKRGGTPIANGQCQVTISGAEYEKTFTGNINNGKCEVIVDATNSPTRIGNYTITAKVEGQTVGSKTVTFNMPNIILPRTGGTIALSLMALAGIFSGVAFYIKHKKKMKVN